MILPSKHLPEDRSLVYLGGEILCLLSGPKTVSRLWDEIKKSRGGQDATHGITFDWFVLALDFLFTVGAIDHERGRVWRAQP